MDPWDQIALGGSTTVTPPTPAVTPAPSTPPSVAPPPATPPVDPWDQLAASGPTAASPTTTPGAATSSAPADPWDQIAHGSPAKDNAASLLAAARSNADQGIDPSAYQDAPGVLKRIGLKILEGGLKVGNTAIQLGDHSDDTKAASQAAVDALHNSMVTGGPLQEGADNLAESIPSMALSLGVGGAARSAVARLLPKLPGVADVVGAGVQGGSQSAVSIPDIYQQGIDQGMSPGKAALNAAGSVAIDTVTAPIANTIAHRLTGSFGLRSLMNMPDQDIAQVVHQSIGSIAAQTGSKALQGIAAGGIQGFVQTVPQLLREKATTNPDMNFGDALSQILQAAGAGAVQGGASEAISAPSQAMAGNRMVQRAQQLEALRSVPPVRPPDPNAYQPPESPIARTTRAQDMDALQAQTASRLQAVQGEEHDGGQLPSQDQQELDAYRAREAADEKLQAIRKGIPPAPADLAPAADQGPDAATAEAQRTIEEQSQVQQNAQTKQQRLDAYRIHADMGLAGEQLGGHYYDEQGQLHLDPKAPNAAVRMGMDRAQDLVDQTIPDRDTATDNPTLSPAARAARDAREEYSPGEVKPFNDPQVDQAQAIAEMTPAKRAKALLELEPGERAAIMPKVRDAISRLPKDPGQRDLPTTQDALRTEEDPTAAAHPDRTPEEQIRATVPEGPLRDRALAAVAKNGGKGLFRYDPKTSTYRYQAGASHEPVEVSPRKQVSRQGQQLGPQGRSRQPDPRNDEGPQEAPKQLGPPRISAADLESQLNALPVSRRTPGLALATMALVHARARSAGMTSDDYVGRHIAGVEDHSPLAQPSLNQGELDQQDLKEAQGPVTRAAVRFLEDGRAVIRAFHGANESSIAHELMHVFRRDLAGGDLATVEEWAGVKNGNWTRAAEEKFARGGEQYLRNGIAPTPELKGVFQQFFKWLHQVYTSVKGSPINVTMSPAATKVMDRLFTPDAMKASGIATDAEHARAARDVSTAAAAVNRSPTDGQKEAGNYAMGHVTLRGMDISIENPKGSNRSGVDPDGKPWSVKMPANYGYVKGTEGADGDHVDVYIGPKPLASTAYVVDQVDAETGKFDEHKAMLGFPDEQSALAAYDAAFSDGKGPQRRGAVTPMPIDDFKTWAASADAKKPLGEISEQPGTRSVPLSDGTTATVDRTHDVPLGGGTAKGDPRKIYLDARLPKTLTMDDGKVADVDRATAEHEGAEKPAMDGGKDYQDAHDQDANPAENSYLRSQGIDPQEYNAKLKPHLDDIQASGKNGNLPPDLETKPYDDSGLSHLLKPSDAPVGDGGSARPDLATPGTDVGARRAFLNERDSLPTVEKRTREDIRTAAQKRVDKDPDRALSDLLKKSEKGNAWNAEDMGAAQHLINQLGQDPSRQADLRRLTMAYQLAGNEGAVALGMRVDQLQTPEGRLAEARSIVSMPRPALAKKISTLQRMLSESRKNLTDLNQQDPEARRQKNRINAMEKALQALNDQADQESARDKSHLKELGFDMDQPHADWAQDPERFKQFVAALEATKGGLPANLREWYMGSLHMSGPVAFKKTAADVLNLTTTMLRRHLEAGVAGVKRSIGLGSADEQSGAELSHMWGAMGPALQRAGANMVDTWKNGSVPRELASGDDDYRYPTMRGWVGKSLRHLSFMSTVRAIDSFSRSLVANVEVAGRAYRSAVDGNGKRLEGDALSQHMANEVNNYASQSWGHARQAAMQATFTERPDSFVQKANRAKYQNANTVASKAQKLGANWLLPFLTIPANIAKQGARDWVPGLSEAGIVARQLYQRHDTGQWEYKGSQFNTDVAQAVLRWGAFAGMGALASQGVVTGNQDKENPLSFNIMGHHFSYKALGPIARAIGAAADFVNAKGSAADRAKAALHGQWDQFSEHPMIRLASDLQQASKVFADEHAKSGKVTRPGDYGTGFLAAHSTGLVVPSIVPQAAKAGSDQVDRHESEKGTNWAQRFLQQSEEHVIGNQGPAVKGPTGRPLVRDSFDSRIGTLLFRVLSPAPLGVHEKGSP